MFPPLEPEVGAVLARFELPPGVTCERFVGGGWSGSRLWKLRAGERAWCLRCYGAEHPTAERLAAVHGAVLAAVAKGIEFLAPPIADRGGATVIREHGRLWDVAPWLPGTPELVTTPSAERVRNAFRGLARLHLAWRDHPWRDLAAQVEGAEVLGPPPGLNARLQFLADLVQGGLREIERGLPRFRSEPWYSAAGRIVDEFRRARANGAPLLEAAARESVPRQVCLRDARPEHFLFVGDELRGVIDYDAVRVDSPVADLARLCGDWDRAAIAAALEAYAEVRPVSEAERFVFDAAWSSAKLLTGMQWLWWLVIDGRVFDDGAALAARLRAMLRS